MKRRRFEPFTSSKEALFLGAFALGACGPHLSGSAARAESVERSSEVNVAEVAPGATALHHPGPPPSPLPSGCRARRSIEEVCRAVLATFEQGTCAPRDCTHDVVVSATGVTAHVVKVERYVCDQECTEVGLLGKAIGSTLESGCWSSTESSAQETYVFEYGGWFWPGRTLETFRSVWSTSQVQSADLRFPEPDLVTWTEYTSATTVVEGDGGTSGTVTEESWIWFAAQLTDDGPVLRFERFLRGHNDDQTSPVRLEGESDADLALREREAGEWQEAHELEEKAREQFEPPALSELPACAEERPCPPLCQASR